MSNNARDVQCRPNSASMKKSSGNMSSTIKKVYLRLRSERRNWSSQLVPQNSLSIEIGLEHTAQCLCFGIEVFGSVEPRRVRKKLLDPRGCAPMLSGNVECGGRGAHLPSF